MDVSVIYKLLIACVSLTVASCQSSWYSFLSCKYIQSRDCYRYGEHHECGSDGITYRNRCDFSKAHCDNTHLHVSHYGSCKSGEFTTAKVVTNKPTATAGPTSVTSKSAATATPAATMPTTMNPILTGSEAVLDFFCLQLSHIDCGIDVDPICGTDNNTYQNGCEFEKHKCTHRDLHVQKFAPCTN